MTRDQQRLADYLGHIFEIVWSTVCNDLPDLYKAVSPVFIDKFAIILIAFPAAAARMAQADSILQDSLQAVQHFLHDGLRSFFYKTGLPGGPVQ